MPNFIGIGPEKIQILILFPRERESKQPRINLDYDCDHSSSSSHCVIRAAKSLKSIFSSSTRSVSDSVNKIPKNGFWTKAGGVEPEDWPQWMRRLKDY